MKNSLLTSVTLISLTTLFSVSTFATTKTLTHFACKTTRVIEGSKPSEFSFVVENIATKKASYWVKDENTEYPITMTPEDSVLMLNDNFGIASGNKGLRLTSDGDGCQFTEVILYKDSGYKSGYISIKDGGCGAEGLPAYSTVVCKVSSK